MGHAFVAAALPGSDAVHKISIIPRGIAALGYTLQLPLEDRYLMSKEELLDKIAGLLGGRAAEEEFVGSISTGAANDLKQATDIARMMCMEYGMSEKLGPLSYQERRTSPFLNGNGAGMLPFSERMHSERAQRRIDGEVASIVEMSMERARHLVRENRDALANVAARLLAVETIEGDELRRILTEAGAKLPHKGVREDEVHEGHQGTSRL